METIVITGGTGLIGSAVTNLLTANGYEVLILSRSAQKPETGKGGQKTKTLHWDPEKQVMDSAALERADYIINLAGAGVADKRWTKARKKEIIESRVQSGQLLVKMLTTIPNKVKAVINVSGIGWYGPDAGIPNSQPFTEEMPAHDDFLGRTCVAWEESIKPVKELGKRLVILRTGVVLSRKGGAFREFKKPLNFGVATILGSGKQVMSWIHIDDICRLFLFAIQNQHVEGTYNAVGPQPVSNRELILELAKKSNKFFIPFYVPSFVLKTVLGELSIEVLKSATVSCSKIQAAGFQFSFPALDAAISNLVLQKH